MLAACSGHREATIDQSREAAQYIAHARGDYRPPGPPEDPWGPYIVEASTRFDVPERWVREVMRVESGGKLYRHGQLITSWVGAMGLMQVMPETYDELRSRYDLSDDAFDPHENILAGTAYMREMYDIYGSPGFLAAYNAGPKRLDDYLANQRPLPDETRRYVAMIGPYVMDSWPKNRSPAENYAMNVLPTEIPPGLRYGRGTAEPVQVAQVHVPIHHGRLTAHELAEERASRKYARLPEPPKQPDLPAVRTASARQLDSHHGFHIINAALAEPLPARRGETSGHWAVQVGAYGSQQLAHSAAGSAHEALGAREGAKSVETVRQGHATLYRARLTGMSKEHATEACQKLARSHKPCMVLAPDSQS